MKHRIRATSGRPRVVAWIVAVTAVGLTLMLIGISFALRYTVDNAIQESIAQETGEIRRFSQTALDPETGGPITTAQRFIDLYLERQQPESAEILLGGDQNGKVVASQSGPEAPPYESIDPAVRQQIMQPNSGGTVTDPVHGTISWQTVRIQASEGAGFISAIVFHQPMERDTRGQLGLLALLALASLLATGVVAWWVSGRIIGHVEQFRRAVSEATEQGGVEPLPERGGPEYVQLAQSANQLLREAESAVESEQRFADDLAYQLRTPLAIVQATLEQPGHTPQQRDLAIRRSHDEVERVRELVDDLVVINQIDRPDYVRPTAGINVARYVSAFVEGWQDRLSDGSHGAKRIEIGELVTDVSATIDEPRLARALDEVVENAFDASDDDVPVVVSTRLLEGRGGGDRVAIDVVDTGREIPADERAEVMRRFVHASNDPTPGSGLGLTIADRLVRAQGGKLRLLDNGESAGTVVRVELPIDDTSQGEDESRPD